MKYLKNIRKLRGKTPYQMYKDLAPFMPGTFSIQAYLRLERVTKAASLPFNSLVGLIHYSHAHGLGGVGHVIDTLLTEALNDAEDKEIKTRKREK